MCSLVAFVFGCYVATVHRKAIIDGRFSEREIRSQRPLTAKGQILVEGLTKFASKYCTQYAKLSQSNQHASTLQAQISRKLNSLSNPDPSIVLLTLFKEEM
jgi:hypothetical protein